MANYDEIKKKAKDALETIADVSVEAYKIAEEKAKVFAKRAKLNAEITREKTQIRRLKFDLGGMYYDLHKDDSEEALRECCETISASLDSIATKRAELEDLKRGAQCCDEAEDFEAAAQEDDFEDLEEVEVDVEIVVEPEVAPDGNAEVQAEECAPPPEYEEPKPEE